VRNTHEFQSAAPLAILVPFLKKTCTAAPPAALSLSSKVIPVQLGVARHVVFAASTVMFAGARASKPRGSAPGRQSYSGGEATAPEDHSWNQKLRERGGARGRDGASLR
jgi:hypothetical protein